ncbi:MAG TPA: neutral/alkaline non-lysosomal ceramidase N-terminal domain-containing protein [Puia sp.]|nr:neutral/alkaline non-lysosomal ceramidase N-terminal domain-containing protein [Puia sp.]
MIKYRKIAVGLFLLLGILLPGRTPAAPGSPGGLRAGVARIAITPSLPMWMTGYAGRDNPASGILHDIWAKALAMEESPGHRIVIVTTDLLGLSHDILEQVTRQVDSLYGIKRDQLLLNSSHTHSGPMIWPCVDVIYDFSLEDQRRVSLYSDTLTAKLVKVIGEALHNLAPAQLYTGHGTADFAINRRNAIHADGPVDHDVPVLKVVTADGKTAAILFGYACHNTTLVENNYLINGDYAGFAQIALEEQYPGVQAMFLMGCAGDQNPAPRGTVELARSHGQHLADAVEKVLSGKMNTVQASIRTAYTTVDLPFRPFDAGQYRKEIVGANKYLQRRARLMLEAYNRGWTPNHLTYPVQAVRFNKDLTILALSDEVVVDYSLRAKKEFAGENLFVSGYSGEVMCYIPSARVLREGGYEADENMIYYGFPGPFADGIEDRVFRAIRRVMKKTGAAATGEKPLIKEK